MIIECPFCHKKYKRLGTHLYNCEQLKELNKDEIHIINLKILTNNDNICEDVCNDYLNGFSLPDLKTKYKLCFKHLIWILKTNNINIRSISESYDKITKNKIINTCREKWNVDNPSQADEVKIKKVNTFIKHYGIDNIWKTKEYAELTSKRWASYTPDKKHELIKKWTKNHFGRVSKLEQKIIEVLNNLEIPIETQFKFPKYFHKYDIRIKNTNVIIEVQGDFWHANPKLYNSNDILNFPNNVKKSVELIWNTDKQNLDYANSQGYIVIEIWESDINNHINENDLDIFLLDILNKEIKISI